MSTTTIPQLPMAIALGGSEQLEIVQAGVSRRTTLSAISGGALPDGIPVLASETIIAGAPVNIYSNAGVANVRNAIANDLTKYSCGWAANGATAGNTVIVASSANTSAQAAALATPGEVFLSDSVPGAYTYTAPSASGSFIQSMGFVVPGQGIIPPSAPRYPL